VKQVRLEPKERKGLVLQAAIDVSRQPGGWSRLTRERIALQAGVSDGLVSVYLGSMDAAKRMIMRAAIKGEIVEIIVQSLVAHDGYAVTNWLPKTLKQKALASVLG
jgi:hypothetical protein